MSTSIDLKNHIKRIIVSFVNIFIQFPGLFYFFISYMSQFKRCLYVAYIVLAIVNK